MDASAARTRPFPQADEPAALFGRERRMHARAYDYWVSLLRGRALPAARDFDPQRLGNFAGRSVVIRLTGAPTVAFLGHELREEAGLADDPATLAAVPAESALGCMVPHLPVLMARRTPVGFEAEQPLDQGGRTLYRGILLPLADDDGALGAIYGIVSWRRLAAVAALPDIAAAVESAFATQPAAAARSPWDSAPAATSAAIAPQPLAQQLAAARTWAALAATDRVHGVATIHAALGAAHDLLLAARTDPDGRRAIGIATAAMTPHDAVALAFGAGWSRDDRAAFVGALHHAQRLGIGCHGLPPLLDRHAGGHHALAAAEQRARRRARATPLLEAEGLPPIVAPIAATPRDAHFLDVIGALPGPALAPIPPAAARAA